MKKARPAPQPPAMAEAEIRCWCGHSELVPFSPDYLRCVSCETLRVARMPSGVHHVTDDDEGFYGKSYWFEHQAQDLGYPDITLRARTDLPERCVHWLRTVLKYKVPPGRALEIGSSHGAFVALLRWAGFDAQGLELSPWVVEYARRTFDVSVLLGPLEAQDVPAGSLDLIALMDVLEHLDDPEATMRRALELLKPNGILVIQTPHYREGRTYEAMVAASDPFLEQLKAEEHLYLFSARSVAELLRRAGAVHVAFEPAIFSQYDMCVVASRAPLVARNAKEAGEALAVSSSGRLVRAILDLDDQRAVLDRKYARAEADRAARLEALERQGAQLARIPSLEAERGHLVGQLAERLELIERQGAELGGIPGLQAEHDHLRQELAARLEVIERQADQLARIPGLQAEHDHQRQQLAERLEVIERQANQLSRIPGLEADVSHLRARFAESEAEVSQVRARLAESEAEASQLRGRLADGEAEVPRLRDRLAESEADRAARVALIEEQGRRIAAAVAALAQAAPIPRLRVAWPSEVRRFRRALAEAMAVLQGR